MTTSRNSGAGTHYAFFRLATTGDAAAGVRAQLRAMLEGADLAATVAAVLAADSRLASAGVSLEGLAEASDGHAYANSGSASARVLRAARGAAPGGACTSARRFETT